MADLKVIVMKKSIALFLAVLELLLFCGCSSKQYRKGVTPEQSTTNFEIYKEYGLRLSELDSIKWTREYEIVLNSYDEISIYFSNDSYRGEKSYETYAIHYRIQSGEYNLDLIVDIVNSVSGIEVTKEEILDIIQNDKEEYRPERYGSYKTEDKQIYRTKRDFWEDFLIAYSLYNDSSEKLHFHGLTKKE